MKIRRGSLSKCSREERLKIRRHMSKPISILIAFIGALALGCMVAYHDIQKYGTDFQAHPNLPVVILTDFFGASLSVMLFYFASRWLYRRKERKLKEAGEDKFYDEVARELQEKTLVAGLWTKAFAEMGGDDAKARALYIKYRVAQLAEASRKKPENQKPEEQTEPPSPPKPEKQIANAPTNPKAAKILAVLACVIIVIVILANSGSNSTSTTSASSTLPAVQTPADSEFDKQIELAVKGDADAQVFLGINYYKGWGFKQDDIEAVKWFRMQPGNSGGALVDERGNVIGIVSAKLDAGAALAASGALPENVNYAVKSSLLLSFLESVPDVSAKLKAPNTADEKFEDVVKSAQEAAVLVLVY